MSILNILIVFSLLHVHFSNSACSSNTYEGRTYVSYEDKTCFLLINRPSNSNIFFQKTAADLCSGYGGSLAVINDLKQENWLIEKFHTEINAGSGSPGIWIGLVRIEDNSEEWEWMPGDGSNKSWYRNWEEDEPNNVEITDSVVEKCVHMDFHTNSAPGSRVRYVGWNDCACSITDDQARCGSINLALCRAKFM